MSTPEIPFHVRTFISKLQSMGLVVQKSGKGWIAQCPAHDDKNPSLSIGIGDAPEYRVLASCKAHCETKAVCAAMGDPTMAILFPAQATVGGIKKLTPPQPALPFKEPESAPTKHLTHVETYWYTDEQGERLFQVHRLLDEETGKKTFRPFRPSGESGIKGVRRVLYLLHEWHGKQKSLSIAEGEKDVHTLRKLKVFATTNMGGSDGWKPEYAQQIKDGGVQQVTVFVDNDDAGRKWADDIARDCHALGIKVRVVELPGLAPKGDVSDWIDQGHTREELRAEVKKIPFQTEPPAPPEPGEVIIVDPSDDDERHMIETEPFHEQIRVGMAHEFAMLFDGRSDAPYEFLYMSFLTALAAACSPYVTVGTGFNSMRVGLYTVLVGASFGGRKTSSRQWALELFEGLASPWNAHLFVPDAVPGSDVGLIKLAKKTEERRPMLLNPDEFSELISKMTIKNSTYTELLNKLFDIPRIGGVSKTFDMEAHVEFSLLSATTDALWTESFTSNTMQVGFLNRLFRVPAYRTRTIKAVQAPDAAGIEEIRARIVLALRRVAAQPVRLEMDRVTQSIYEAWMGRCESSKMIFHEDYARLETYAQRIAAVLTVAEWGSHPLDVAVPPFISPLAMTIACALADWQYRARLWSRPVNADNPYAVREAQLRVYLARVLREPALTEGGPPRVPQGRKVRKRDVQQHFGHWGATAFNWAVNAMVSSQEIEVEGDATKGEEVFLRISSKGLFNALR